jgi:hypothetical protein
MRRTDKHRMEREGRRKGRFHRGLIYEERKTKREERRKRRSATTFEKEAKKERSEKLFKGKNKKCLQITFF